MPVVVVVVAVPLLELFANRSGAGFCCGQLFESGDGRKRTTLNDARISLDARNEKGDSEQYGKLHWCVGRDGSRWWV